MRWESECWWRQSLVWVYVERFQVKRPTFQIRLGIRREKDEKRKKLCTRGCIYSQVYKQNSTTNRQQCNMKRVKEIRWNFWLSIFCQKLGVISTKHVSSLKCPSILSLSLSVTFWSCSLFGLCAFLSHLFQLHGKRYKMKYIEHETEYRKILTIVGCNELFYDWMCTAQHIQLDLQFTQNIKSKHSFWFETVSFKRLFFLLRGR